MYIFTFLKKELEKFFFKLKYKWFLEDELRGFFFDALNRQLVMSEMKLGPSSLNYYEFGVGWGGTLKKFITALKIHCNVRNRDLYSYHIYAFDSFEGLPEKKSSKDDSIEWSKGAYSYEIFEIKKKLLKQGIDLKRNTVHFVKGFYEKSLTPDLRNKLLEHPPSIINIDCDYYSSTKIVLEWLRPMMNSGTILYFDDIWSFHGHPKYGQLAAIQEFNKVDDGQLVLFQKIGPRGQVYIFSRKEFEYTSIKNDL